MAVYYEPMAETLLENTTMKKVFVNGVHRLYEITPNDGYVLHDSRNDVYDNFDDEGNPVGEPSILGFQRGATTCTVADFDTNKYDFYVVLDTDVPENSYIYGDTTEPDHEIM